MRPSSLAENDKGYGYDEGTIHPGLLMVNVKTYNDRYLIFGHKTLLCKSLGTSHFNVF